MKGKLLFPIIFCLTIGLATFVPEPHLFGKLRWILGGAKRMQLMDYFDLFLHGLPWVWFGISILLILKKIINL